MDLYARGNAPYRIRNPCQIVTLELNVEKGVARRRYSPYSSLRRDRDCGFGLFGVDVGSGGVSAAFAAVPAVVVPRLEGEGSCQI
jgi:hypothetical protein